MIFQARDDVILEVSTTLFHERGYANVGMRAIAEAVGIQPASIYHHFSSKEEILYSISLTVTEQFVNEYVLSVVAEPADFLRRVIANHVAFGYENQAAVSLARREVRELTSEHYESIREHERGYYELLERQIEVGKRDGIFGVENARIATLAIVGMLNGINDWYNVAGPLSIQEVAEIYTHMIVDKMLSPVECV